MRIAIGIIFLIFGFAAGLLLFRITVSAIQKRTDRMPAHIFISGKKARIIWAITAGTLFLVFYLFFGLSLKTFEGIYVFSAISVLSAVDIVIRKIPNGILFSLMIGAIVFLALGNSLSAVGNHLLGMAMGACIFLIPFVFGKQAGAGDIKYAATMGFFLGFYNTAVALAIMSVFYLCFVSVLLISKKSNLKASLPLGPHMSIGFLLALLIVGVA